MTDPWSWNAVLETLTGTSMGALVGVGGIAWQTRSEKKERYETQLTGRLFELNNSMKEMIPASAALGKVFNREVIAVSVALANISMIAHKEDREFIERLGEVCKFEKSYNLVSATDLFAFIIGTIVGWRNQYKPPEFYLTEISKRINAPEAENRLTLFRPSWLKWLIHIKGKAND